ncbi:Sec16 [Macleaya cordata]|uniref:Protein transport protein sec16 n=1 Tax=Macleaya cordata TaxID=56857 RepID=A0A200PSH9_MACCD|nr:Sec16 [Macleaya cordata]
MATPPFQVEDTDEDFFDKLVDDEFGVSESGSSVVDGADSDELKAFSNLSIGEVATVSEDSTRGEIGFSVEGEKNLKDDFVPSADSPEKDTSVKEENVSLISNSSVFDNVESNNASNRTEISLDSSKSSASKTTCIKEVQWSSLYADSDQRSESGFGSYSDFFTESGDNSVDPFAEVGSNLKADTYPTSGITENEVYDSTASSNFEQHKDGQSYRAATEQTTSEQDLNNSQYWENLYPGWRYDPNTGEWYQVDCHDATVNTQGKYEDIKAQETGADVVSTQLSEASYLQQTTPSVMGMVAENCTTSNVAKWNLVSQGSTEYPAHMIFDPQYPGWYYDTIAQEWHLLESYTPAVQSTNTAQEQTIQDGNASVSGVFVERDQSAYNEYGKVETYGSQSVGSQGQVGDWAVQQNITMWQPKTIAENDAVAGFTENQHTESLYDSRGSASNSLDQHIGFKPMATASYEQTGRGYGGYKGGTEFQSFIPADNFSHQLNQPKVEQNTQMTLSHDFNGSKKSGSYSHQPFQTGTQSSYIPKEGRSSDGRPPHALVTFGFGGKLIVVKDSSSFVTNTVYTSKDCVGGSISVLDLMDVVEEKNDSSSIGFGTCDYFRTLCHQSFPGPLVGGNIGNKELNTWIDERIANCGSPDMDYRNGELLRLLLSLLKIACQHYGKLRSPFGTDPSLKENDRPESAVAKLFGSAKRSGAQLTGYASHTHCLTNVPSEGKIRATAAEVQKLLVSGRTKEALQCAQEGQLWGPALILAAQLGDQFYIDTVKQMAHLQLVAGSPLRTLCLLIAGQPADVFSTNSMTTIGPPGAAHMFQHHAQVGANGMLDDWEENLAVITANRTKGDELVILHLGDCLWKERGEVTAAHICYLVAEANFESFSDSARLCLIGADHWRFPRTYASPEAIQRTELYEYSTVLGNSQSVLLPFQPYKLIYAHMLAEVGKVSESLKYCHTILKSLKTGRAPEVEAWKQLVSSLEERIRAHQQGGFGINLAPGKLVGKLLPFIDRSIHRMIGPPPPPVPSVQSNEHDYHPPIPRVPVSQSTMAMSSLMPSASMEPISEWTGDSNGRSMPNRSISEPDFGRSPRQGHSSKEGASVDAQSKASVSGGPSRFGRFGSQLILKTMGWVSRSRPDRQAKLGEKNKFYYDEKLKRWVEEGAEPPAEETSLPPPPTTAVFQNGMTDYNIKTALKSESLPGHGVTESKSPTHSERSSGMPPIPPSSNQYSSRGRMNVRSRYVDTFHQGGGTSAKLFQSPSVPVAKTAGAAYTKFFVPTPAPLGEQTVAATGESMQEPAGPSEDLSTVMTRDSFFSSQPPPQPTSSPSMQRFASMNNIAPTANKVTGVLDGSLSSRSRRTASWSGSFTGANNSPNLTEMKPLGEVLGILPSPSMPNDPSSSMHLTRNGASFGEDLQEVEL